MEKNYRKHILILNIFYSLVLILGLISSVINLFDDDANLFFFIPICIITILAIIGVWLLYGNNTNTAMILLTIKKIIKYILFLFILFVVVILLFLAQDCANSFNDIAEVTPKDRIDVAWPFVVIALLDTFYMITYLIFFSSLKKGKVSKALAVIISICNILISICIIINIVVSIIDNSINYLLIGTELFYIPVLLISSYIMYKKYINNTFDKTSEKEYN